MTAVPIDKVVILARGLGTRMIEPNDRASLNPEQAAMADTGVKALIPIDRPFLDYVLSLLADAGFRKVSLVIGPEHDQLRDYYGRRLKTKRLQISFAVQQKPLGTADALLAAESFADGDQFAMINSDNYYPLEALRKLQQLDAAGTAVFDRRTMFTGSNISPDRICASAVVQLNQDGYLQRIIEKPDAQTLSSLTEPFYVSKNCWRFTSAIFQACRSITPSPRGQLEITDAVQYAIDQLHQSFKVLPVQAAVLDLSYRSDIDPIARILSNVQVNL